MPPSGAIALTNLLTLPALFVIGWLLFRLWKRPRWGAYGFGLVVIIIAMVISGVLATVLYSAGGPLFYALMAFTGYLMLAAPVYLVVGLIVLLARKAVLARTSAA